MARLPSLAGPGLVCYTAVVQPLGAVLSHGAAPVCPGQWHSVRPLHGTPVHGFHPGQAKVAFIFICEPIRATDQVGCLGTVWKLSHVLTEGHSGENKAPS